MVTFKTRKRDGRVFPIQGAEVKSNVNPDIIKLNRFERARAVVVLKKGNKFLDSDIKTATTKKEISNLTRNKKEINIFIQKLRSQKPLSNKELKKLSIVSRGIGLASSPFSPTPIRVVKTMESAQQVISKRLRKMKK